MIFKQSAMVAILFFKVREKFSQAKHLHARMSHGQFLHSEAVGPVRRDILGHFSLLTAFGFKAKVKGQTQHLEKFPRP